MVAISNQTFNAVQPVATRYGVPTSLWEDIAQVESGNDPSAVGDKGTSFGLFQLHLGGQFPSQYLNNPTALEDPGLNATYAMPSIANAWNSLKGSFNPNSLGWWEQFASQSGHPGGTPGSQTNKNEAMQLMQNYQSSNTGTSQANSCPQDDICLCCGKKGSTAYLNCSASVAIGVVPDCAAKGAGIPPSTQVACNWADPLTWDVCLGDPIGTASKGLANLITFSTVLGNPSTWQRVGLFVFALVVVFLGVMVLK